VAIAWGELPLTKSSNARAHVRTSYPGVQPRLHYQGVAVPGQEKPAHQCHEVGAVRRGGAQQGRGGQEEPRFLAIALSQTEKEGKGQTLTLRRR